MTQSNTQENTIIDDEGFEKASALGLLFAGIHGILDDRGGKSGQILSRQMKAEYKKFAENYKKKEGKQYAPLSEIGQAFLMAYPKFWNNKEVYYKKLDNPDAEEKRQEQIKEIFTYMFANDDLVSILRDETTEKLTPQQLEKYKKEIEKQGLKGFDKFIEEANKGFINNTPLDVLTENNLI